MVEHAYLLAQALSCCPSWPTKVDHKRLSAAMPWGFHLGRDEGPTVCATLVRMRACE